MLTPRRPALPDLLSVSQTVVASPGTFADLVVGLSEHPLEHDLLWADLPEFSTLVASTMSNQS